MVDYALLGVMQDEGYLFGAIKSYQNLLYIYQGKKSAIKRIESWAQDDFR